ncbi:MAG: DEAD/DEAH box helicase [Polyangiales bacterium]
MTNAAARLAAHVPAGSSADADALLDAFLAYSSELGLTLYPAQEEAILELFQGHNVILNTPTGSGKSLVARAAHFYALAGRRASVYTAPIKALVNEKFFELCAELGPERVGLLTGDASVNVEAPVLCCTAEILAQLALRHGADLPLGTVIMDEFHFFADRERGVSWEVPLLTLPQCRFLLMSATLGPTQRFQETLAQHTGAPTTLVAHSERPVPLSFHYGEAPLLETLATLLEDDKAPIYIVYFTQRAATEEAQHLVSLDVLSSSAKSEVRQSLQGEDFSTPFGPTLKRFLSAGIGVHHAGLLPRYRRLVERLAARGQLKLICGTDTLGVGVNIPIRTVLFTQLCKFDGEKTKLLSVRAFQQIAGRAGRRGFDAEGHVVVQAPAHVIENRRLAQKAGDDAKKKRKLVFRKPPERGYAHWERSHFERLVHGEPEALTSRFQVSQGMVLSLLERGPEGCKALRDLIRRAHIRPVAKRRQGRKAIAIIRALRTSGVLRRVEDDSGVRDVVNLDYQRDFALHNPLALYLIDLVSVLDPDEDDYAAKVLAIAEAIAESPTRILLAMRDKLRRNRLAELKAADVEYEARMQEIEALNYPQPEYEWLTATFEIFLASQPWLGGRDIDPKGIVLQMYSEGWSFSQFVKEYGLMGSEGLLLRYLSDVYKILAQSLPAPARSETTEALAAWLRALIRHTDSSLLDEWETLQDGQRRAPGAAELPAPTPTWTPSRLQRWLRQQLWAILAAWARRDHTKTEKLLRQWGAAPGSWPAARLETAWAPYWQNYDSLRTDAEARAPKQIDIEVCDDGWRVCQHFLDPEGHGEWQAHFRLVPPAQPDEMPQLHLHHLGPENWNDSPSDGEQR